VPAVVRRRTKYTDHRRRMAAKEWQDVLGQCILPIQDSVPGLQQPAGTRRVFARYGATLPKQLSGQRLRTGSSGFRLRFLFPSCLSFFICLGRKVKKTTYGVHRDVPVPRCLVFFLFWSSCQFPFSFSFACLSGWAGLDSQVDARARFIC
jgi:hypothetical protein